MREAVAERRRGGRAQHRRDRHPGQQRRHAVPRAAGGFSGREVGAAARHQCLQRVLCRPGGRAAHDPARPRQDHQHRLGAERTGAAGHRALHRHQGRDQEPDPRHVHRLGEARPADQRHRAGLFQDAAQPGAGRQSRILDLAGKAHAGRPLGQCRGAGRRGRVPVRRRPRPSSTATRSMSTAGSPPVFGTLLRRDAGVLDDRPHLSISSLEQRFRAPRASRAPARPAPC